MMLRLPGENPSSIPISYQWAAALSTFCRTALISSTVSLDLSALAAINNNYILRVISAVSEDCIINVY